MTAPTRAARICRCGRETTKDWSRREVQCAGCSEDIAVCQCGQTLELRLVLATEAIVEHMWIERAWREREGKG